MKEQPSDKQTPEQNNSQDKDNRLEAVRDLLFGPNDQEYREEFKGIKDQIAKNRADFENKTGTLKTDILERLDKLENKLSEKVSSLESSISQQIDGLNNEKVDRKKLANLLQTIAKELEA